jgi:hypothetical protein
VKEGWYLGDYFKTCKYGQYEDSQYEHKIVHAVTPLSILQTEENVTT